MTAEQTIVAEIARLADEHPFGPGSWPESTENTPEAIAVYRAQAKVEISGEYIAAAYEVRGLSPDAVAAARELAQAAAPGHQAYWRNMYRGLPDWLR